jgi:protein-disulfide isomerase
VAKKESTSSNQVSTASPRTFIWVAAASIFSSVVVHGLLLHEHLQLRFGQVAGTSLCNISETFNCAAVAASRFSELMGVPMALWGASANLVLLLLLAYYPFTDENDKPVARLNLLLISGFIALMSIVMGAISAFALSRYCPFCIVTYVLSFVTFASLWLALRRKKSASALLAKSSFAFGGFVPALSLSAVAFVGSFIANDQMKKSYGFSDIAPFIQERIQEWQSEPSVRIDTVQPLVLGAAPDKAKMTIVEFADYRCIHCKHAAPPLKAFVAAHPDVRLEFQAWPLDGECNTAISRANGASCLLARAVQCAENLGGAGWAAHNFIFENQDRFPSVESVRAFLPSIASATSVPASEFQACAESTETKTAIEKQAAVGTALNLTGTPTIYVNGRKLPGGQSIPVLTEAYKKIQAQK